MRKVYQFTLELRPVAKYASLLEAGTALGISWKTISSAIINGNKCHGKWFFSKKPEMSVDRVYYDETLSVKTSIVLTKSMSEELIILVGQRNKQQIIREVLQKWIDEEKKLKENEKEFVI
jgi:hypothetical protein